MTDRSSSAGTLRERVTFSEPTYSDDGGGGVHAAFCQRFTVWAEFIHLRGGEAVLAGRLAGKHAQIIRVRLSSATRCIKADWRVVDRKTSTVFNIREVVETVDRKWIDVLAESGVAA